VARILYAWELGGNSGHVTGFSPIAAELERGGHEILFAARDLQAAAALKHSHPKLLIAQAPLAPRPTVPYQQPVSYPELLALMGYSDANTLASLVRGWLDLIRLFRAQVVVADYAPTAGLAARIARIPLVRLDLGFTRPPRRRPLPSMLPWEKVSAERLERSEEQVLRRVNAVLRAHGERLFDELAELLDANEKFLLTFPELDHYEDRANERYDGPFYLDSIGEAREWPKGDRPRVLVYLRPGRALEPVLEAIAALGAVAHCYVPGASPELGTRFAGRDIHISAHPLRLTELLAEAHATVTYGSHGYVSAALLAGVPCIVVPTDVEKAGLARRVAQIGAGATVSIGHGSIKFKSLLDRTFGDAACNVSAKVFARRHRSHRAAAIPANIAAVIQKDILNAS
jgi:UDP:flavonoid glycosyltransferase YjiC (YdhE family)